MAPLSEYSPVDSIEKEANRNTSDEGSESDLFLPTDIHPSQRRKALRYQYLRLGLEAILLTGSLIALTVTLFYKPSLLQRQKECGRLLGQWLPDAEQGIEYEVQRFKGTFGLQSPYTGVGPETDAAWDNITDDNRPVIIITAPVGGAIGITKEQWEAVNEFHEYPVLLEEDHGTGQYLASLDVFHQLHCVDLLRKSLHREYYDQHEGSFAGAPKAVVNGHLEHCVETLRQTIMCHGDISLLTYNWVAGRDMPYPNFNTVHTCKKWDALTEWNMRRDITVEWTDGMGKHVLSPPLKPNDLKGMTTPP